MLGWVIKIGFKIQMQRHSSAQARSYVCSLRVMFAVRGKYLGVFSSSMRSILVGGVVCVCVVRRQRVVVGWMDGWMDGWDWVVGSRRKCTQGIVGR